MISMNRSKKLEDDILHVDVAISRLITGLKIEIAKKNTHIFELRRILAEGSEVISNMEARADEVGIDLDGLFEAKEWWRSADELLEAQKRETK